MLSLLQEMLERLSSVRPDKDIASLVERAVDHVDPRLKAFGNYPDAYVEAISTASDYAETLVDKLPAFVELSASDYATSPLWHALFTDAEAIETAIRESVALQEYDATGDDLYALMGMRRHEKQAFGLQMEGDVLRRNVAQTLIYFDNHTLTLPSANLEELHLKLKIHFFDSLIRTLADNISDGVAERRELETERDVLASRLRSQRPRRVDVEFELREVRKRLVEMEESYTLHNYHKLFDAYMEHPAEHLRLESTEIPIDMRGVMRHSDERLAGEFEFYDLVGRDRRRWTLYPVKVRSEEVQRAREKFGAKERWMVI